MLWYNLFQCSTIISAYDDDIIDLYTSKQKDIKKQLCSSLSGK